LVDEMDDDKALPCALQSQRSTLSRLSTIKQKVLAAPTDEFHAVVVLQTFTRKILAIKRVRRMMQLQNSQRALEK